MEDRRKELKETRYFLKRESSAYPTLDDWSQRTVLEYGIKGVPETVIIDRDGMIVRHVVGPINYREVKTILDGLL